MPDNKVSITKRLVDSLEYKASGQNIYFDKTLPGFAVRIFKSCKTYVVQARVNGKAIRRTVGKHGHFTPEQARVEAQSLLAVMAKDHDPTSVKTQDKTRQITLGQLFEAYISKRSLRTRTVTEYNGVMRRCLSDWMDRPISTLTRDEVEERLNQISTANGPRGQGKGQGGQTYRLLRGLMRFANQQYEVEGIPIFTVDPTRNLSRGRPWTENIRRQGVLQRHQLPNWFDAVLTLENTTAGDYLLLTLLTGLRRNEGLSLKWADIDLQGRYLRISADRAKNHQEHRLPLSNYLYEVLKGRLNSEQLKRIFPL